MRDDMDEVIVERPRPGSRWIKHARRTRRIDAKVMLAHDPDALPAQIGVRRWAAMSRHSKSFNENLAPLRRYLKKQVGRPWDKVWSEISENLSAASTVQQHVRDHIGDFVAARTFIKNGTVYVTGRYGEPCTLVDCHQRMYVDPRTGTLRQNKYYRACQQGQRAGAAKAARQRATRMREIAPDTQVHNFEERGWWEVKLAPLVRLRASHGGYYYSNESVFDVVLSPGWSKLRPQEFYGRAGVHAVSKRQLTSKEIATLDLRVRTPIPQRSRL